MKELYCRIAFGEINLPATAKWALAFVAAEWLKVPAPMRALMFLMAADYVTGVYAAYVNQEISSSKALRGFVTKLLILLLLKCTGIIEQQSGHNLGLIGFGTMGCMFAEFISLAENMSKAGVALPEKLVKALIAVKKVYRMATPEELKELEEGGKSKGAGAGNGA